MKAMGDLEDRNKSVVHRFGEALNNHDLDSLNGLVARDFVRHCQATPWIEIRSLEEFKRFMADDWTGVPDAQITPRFLVAESDLVAFFNSYAGTQTGQWGTFPPSGKRVDFDLSGVFRLAGGKIAEMWLTWDNLAILSQLGQQPPMAEKAGG
jgi:predicted ester cyclase